MLDKSILYLIFLSVASFQSHSATVTMSVNQVSLDAFTPDMACYQAHVDYHVVESTTTAGINMSCLQNNINVNRGGYRGTGGYVDISPLTVSSSTATNPSGGLGLILQSGDRIRAAIGARISSNRNSDQIDVVTDPFPIPWRPDVSGRFTWGARGQYIVSKGGTLAMNAFANVLRGSDLNEYSVDVPYDVARSVAGEYVIRAPFDFRSNFEWFDSNGGVFKQYLGGTGAIMYHITLKATAPTPVLVVTPDQINCGSVTGQSSPVDCGSITITDQLTGEPINESYLLKIHQTKPQGSPLYLLARGPENQIQIFNSPYSLNGSLRHKLSVILEPRLSRMDPGLNTSSIIVTMTPP